MERLAAERPPEEEEYPRVILKKQPSTGYYIALGLVLSVWVITPFSCAYLLWFAIFALGRSYGPSLTATIFAAYALTEVVFAIYLHYLIRFVQLPPPSPSMPVEVRQELYYKIIHTGLTLPVPIPSPPDEGDAYIAEPEKAYRLGFISGTELHHARDHEYRDAVGLGRARRRVGKMTVEDREVIEAFVEDRPGDRDDRLRAEIEGRVTKSASPGDTAVDPNGIRDNEGGIIKLHAYDRRAIEFRERMRTWFNHAPWSSLKRQNVLIWLSWSCFGLRLEDVQSDEQQEFLSTTMDLLEARTGTTFPEGYNADIELLRLTLDPVNAKGRPLILYALSQGINYWLKAVMYPYHGMGRYRDGDIEYLVRIPPKWTADAMPIVYLHGLGFGLLQSHLLIKELLTTLAMHPILIPLAPHTSQAVFDARHLRPWGRAEFVDTMKRIMTKWGFWEEGTGGRRDKGGVSMLSHSNGSVGHGWLLKDCPGMILRNTFVDPVVFCLWEGDVCHSFCYRRPTNALELLLYYFIASEVGIANYIRRHFDWADNTLLFDQIPYGDDSRRTAFFLGGKDMIIDAARTRKYLESHGVTGNGLQWDADAGHGESLLGEALYRVIKYAGTGSTRGWQDKIPAPAQESRAKSHTHAHPLGELPEELREQFGIRILDK